MQIDIVGPEACGALRGVVVVIDVLRAFTTAGYAFGAGAREIVLVATIEEAEALRAADPGALLIGEVDGYPIDGFDFGNSPAQIVRRSFDRTRLVQRTTSGTCAAVAARGAELILAASFVCAEATVQHILQAEPAHVALVLSGRRGSSGGADDLACADYLFARLRGEQPPAGPFLARVRESSAARRFLAGDQPAFPPDDLDLALAIDRFDFAMAAEWRDGLLVLERTPPANGRPTA
jgi:2-phosphosulfolactate phosphatase